MKRSLDDMYDYEKGHSKDWIMQSFCHFSEKQEEKINEKQKELEELRRFTSTILDELKEKTRQIIDLQEVDEVQTKEILDQQQLIKTLSGHEVQAQQSQEKSQYSKQGFIYILRTRESVRFDEPVYKVGKTYDMEQRFKQYPKGSELLKSIKVCERHIAERVLLREFSSKFTNREEFGNEYFEGDLQEMLVIFEEFSRIFV